MKQYTNFLFLMFFVKSVMAQPLDAEIKAINSLPPDETIHIHFDRTVYMPGDTIWFKAYLRQGSVPSGVSTILYTHLYDASGKIILSKQLPVLYYSAQGFFVLPASMPSSLVGVTAYTPFIAANHPSFVFQQFLPVLEKPEQVIVPSGIKTTKPQLQFFPEGGAYVANTETKIAIKASDQNGKPLAVKGIIKDSYGDTVTFFQTNNIGVGVVKVKADEEGLTAVWWSADNANHTADLPTVTKEGAVVHVEKNPKSDYVFKVKRNPDVFPERAIYQLLVYTPGQALFEAQMNLTENPVATGRIKSDSLPAGVITFLLLDEKKNILSQRSVYHAVEKTVTPIQVTIKEKGLGKRALNTVELELPQGTFANLSVAVTDAYLPEDEQFSNDIATGFLLNSELDGNTTHYETVVNNHVADMELMDMLMLIHPWKKAAASVAAFTQPISLTASKFIKLKGVVTGLSSSDLSKAGNLNILFQTSDSTAQLVTLVTDPQGRFEVDNMLFYDSARLNFYFDKKPKGNYKVEIEPFFETAAMFSRLDYPSFNVSSTAPSLTVKQLNVYEEYAAKSKNGKIGYLSEIVVSGRKKSREQELDEIYTTGFFRTERSIRYDIVNDPYFNTYTDLISFLRAKLPPSARIFQEAYAGGQLKIMWRFKPTQLYIDEQLVTMQDVINLPLEQVGYVKIFRPVFFGMYDGAGGAIGIYTKRNYVPDRSKQIVNRKHDHTINLRGFSQPRQFYSPDFTDGSVQNQMPDTRKTLYWNPVVVTDDESGKAVIQFYNNDICTAYKIVVQGMDAKGRIVYYEKIIK